MEPGVIEGAVAAAEDADHARIAATTEEDVQRYMREDGELVEDQGGPDVFTVTAVMVRAKTGLSQAAFAEAIGLPVATWRNWEQGRTRIDPAGRTLLRLLAADPRGSLAALKLPAKV